VVVATRNRRDELRRSLLMLSAMPERPDVIVVDNGSSDGTADVVTREFPLVRLVCLDHNLGPAARTIGAACATSDLVAFADDDSWWAPGSLRMAGDVFDRYPEIGLIAATVLVGDDDVLDPVTVTMRHDVLPSNGLPGPAVLGFLACGAVVRREAFLTVGGFEQHRVGGEETLLAIDMAAAGWRLAHVPEVVAHHHPSAVRDAHARATAELHNEMRTAWLRLPFGEAVARTLRTLRRAASDRDARRSLGLVAREAPWLLRHRRRVAPWLDRQLAAVEAHRPPVS
jgi:GT2 family glycosyltransferase